MKGILFLSTRNACVSQMAEGFARRMGPPELLVQSAGLQPTALDASAVRAMAEVGVDLTAARAKGLDEVALDAIDTVILLDDAVRDTCPVFRRGVRVISWSFDDPQRAVGRPEKIRAEYRNVREQVRSRIERFLAHEAATV